MSYEIQCREVQRHAYASDTGMIPTITLHNAAEKGHEYIALDKETRLHTR